MSASSCPSTARPARWWPAGLVAVAGAVAVLLVAAPPSGAAGPDAVTRPSVLLGIFDTLVVLVLALPHRGPAAVRAGVVLAALPLHVSLASAAGAGAGHAVATLLLAGAWWGAGRFAGSGRRAAAFATAVACGVPALGYVVGDLLGQGLGVAPLILASPWTGPALLAARGPLATAADGVPAVVAAALVLAGSRLLAHETEESA